MMKMKRMKTYSLSMTPHLNYIFVMKNPAVQIKFVGRQRQDSAFLVFQNTFF
jgi:hypothetical protein